MYILYMFNNIPVVAEPTTLFCNLHIKDNIHYGIYQAPFHMHVLFLHIYV